MAVIEWIVLCLGLAIGGIGGWMAHGQRCVNREHRRVVGDLAREVERIKHEWEMNKVQKAER